MEEICSMSQCLYTCLPHVKFLVSPMYWTWMMGLSCSSATNLNGQCFRSFWTIWSWNLRPISRFASNTVFWGFVVICAFAASPISRWVSVKATTEGVVRFPISLGIISTLSSFHTPTQEYLRMINQGKWKARCSKINSDTISLYVWNSKKKQIPDFVIADISRQPFLERKTNFGTSKKRAYSFPSLFPYYFCLCWHVRLNRLLLDCVESVTFMEKSYQITSSSMNLLSTRDNRFVQIFHRHGDRTPLNNYFAGSDLEKEEVETWKALVRISRCIYSRFQTERMSRLCITCTSLRDTKRILLQTRFLASLHIMEFSRCVMSENNSWECKFGLTCRRRYIWTRSSSSLPRTTITRTY